MNVRPDAEPLEEVDSLKYLRSRVAVDGGGDMDMHETE